MDLRKIGGVGIFLISYHLLILLLLPIYLVFFGIPSLGIIISSVIMYVLTGLSVTAGFHRLYSHRAYKTNKIFEFFLLIFAALSAQGSIIKWSYKHRIHHKFVDSERDPYSAKKGFWYSHMGWMLKKEDGKIEEGVVKDLLKNNLLMFQHKHDILLTITLNLIFIVGFGFIFNDFFGSFLFTFLLRMFATHHSTFFVNSLAHFWGAKPYSHEHTAVNNFIVAILTLGEGYHNYHHTFASDYRNGVRWWQFDPTKVFIWGLSKFGVTKELKKINRFGIKKKLIVEDKELLFDKLKQVGKTGGHLEMKLQSLYGRLTAKIDSLWRLKNERKKLKLTSQKSKIKDLRREIKFCARCIKMDMREWRKLCGTILSID